MISSGIDPQLIAKQVDTKDVARFKQQMDGLKQRLGQGAPDQEKELRKACQNFEAVFISKLWQGMKSTVPKEGYLHSKQEEQYVSMFDREFAENMSKAGGIGLADMIYDQLSEKLKQSSRDTLSGGVPIKPLVNGSIPLKTGQTSVPLTAPQPMTLEQWGGALSDAGGSDSVTTQTMGGASSDTMGTTQVLNDIDVQARLESLARKLEAERIKQQLLGTAQGGNMYEAEKDVRGKQVGRKLAKIG